MDIEKIMAQCIAHEPLGDFCEQVVVGEDALREILQSAKTDSDKELAASERSRTELIKQNAALAAENERLESVIKAAQEPAYELNYQYDEGKEDPELGGDLIFHQLNGKDYPAGTLFYSAPVPAQSPAVAAVSSGTSCCGCRIEKGRLFCSAQSSLDRCPSHEPLHPVLQACGVPDSGVVDHE